MYVSLLNVPSVKDANNWSLYYNRLIVIIEQSYHLKTSISSMQGFLTIKV